MSSEMIMLTQFREMPRYAGAMTLAGPPRERDLIKLANIFAVALLLFIIASSSLMVRRANHD
jgi:hypothetical protein